ncbi:MAG: putative xanthine dehydrogenase subunit A [Syntrophorhabdus sp. PtaU1.Bin058]|nr:MAG: putative xanthine dehydrogenase subunit A [Syntrophorhabdus sp. PtaU1.Bin058]
MMNIYETIEQYLTEGRIGILATVIYRDGSAPRDVGAKMLVGEDGKCFGTVGGGRLEGDACREAMNIMHKGELKILSVRMDSKAVADDGMLCGGNVDILLEPVLQKYKGVYKRIGEMLQQDARGVVVTKFGDNVFSKTFIEEDLSVTGDTLPEKETGELLNYLHEKRPYYVSGGMIIEPLQSLSVLYVFGAGHISQFLACIAKTVDFHVVVIDDRKEFANRERFPDAAEIIVDDFHKVMDRLDFTGKEYVAIVTRGHQYDADVLEEALKKKTKYVGMIGSRRKVRIILDHMRQSGFDEEAIANVHSPIGLSIHAETPQEIAVSIVAELIAVRRTR